MLAFKNISMKKQHLRDLGQESSLYVCILERAQLSWALKIFITPGPGSVLETVQLITYARNKVLSPNSVVKN